ncbi:AP2 domain-containing protein [Cephalotus follicularis]|uniref:AP2 domain-containing protein n=1 Tax=Cephalotus follicularis TaxID=3775 RepID=A0A1Q3CKH6_CEPFO|nr:AP2 domain-containing protein [Cephalotus follicularis]
MVRPKSQTTTTTTSTSAGESSNRSNEPKYKGVRKRKWGKWVSEIRMPNSRERIWLGSYDTQEKAARAFDAALYCLRGRNATFNFPDNPPEIVGGQSMSPQEIQVVAARYATEDIPIRNLNGYENSVLPVDLHSQMMEQSTTTSSSNGVVHVDNGHRTMDWSFLDTWDSYDQGRSYFGLYSGFDNIGSDDLYTPVPPSSTTTTTTQMDDDTVYNQNSGEAYSQMSFLWNFSDL